MKFEVKKYGWYIWSALLLAGVGILAYSNSLLSGQVDDLRAQLDEYKEQEGHSYVVERISKQMEEIAYQQKDISEKQREEAVFQMGIAEQMRMRAEEERKKAEEFSRNAVEARNMAESQRELAVQQQLQAEYARNVADTLSNVALGRALALLSNVQYRAGNKDVASLLAYASWKYTSEYNSKIKEWKITKIPSEIFRCAAIFFIVGLVFIISLVAPFCSADWSALKNCAAIENCHILRMLAGANWSVSSNCSA